MREHLLDLGVLLPVVAFGIVFGVCLLKPLEKIFRACGRVLKNRRVEDTTSREMWASEITRARWEVWFTGGLSFSLHGRGYPQHLMTVTRSRRSLRISHRLGFYSMLISSSERVLRLA